MQDTTPMVMTHEQSDSTRRTRGDRAPSIWAARCHQFLEAMELKRAARCSAVHFIKILVFLLCISQFTARVSHDSVDSKVLNVGEELWMETLPLQMGSRLFQLQGLKSNTWYEVKISYPASIPSSFSIQLKRGNAELGLNHNRRLLNTEKLIFKTESLSAVGNQDAFYALVTVKPEGVVAMPHTKERQFAIFNIVCDELLLGLPHKAWWVVILVLLCLGLAFVIPCFLPSNLLTRKHSFTPPDLVSKDS